MRCMTVETGGVSATAGRQVEYDDGGTTVTSPAVSSCGSLTESDVFTTPRTPCPLDDDDDQSTTLRSDYEPARRPDDSWKALTQHVIGGGYQIRPAAVLHRVRDDVLDGCR